jgi:predicted metal-dependent hydrolase
VEFDIAVLLVVDFSSIAPILAVERRSMMSAQHTQRHPIEPRKVAFDYGAGVPRYWLADSVVATHIANAVNMLFPAGERFFVRSVRRFLPQVDDPVLREQALGFFGQEGRHAREHDRQILSLEAQGIEVRPFLDFYERVAFGLVEPLVSPELRLAVTAALEHYTAIMADNAFEYGLLDQAHPTMRGLLLWHAAEEIEHKAVAFDVLQRVAPGYGLRVGGMAVATVGLGVFWAIAFAWLMRQEEGSVIDHLRAFVRAQRVNPIAQRVFLRGLREYLRPDFHPWDSDNLARAQAHLSGVAEEAA